MNKEDFVGFSRRTYNPIIRPETEKLLRQTITKFQPQKVLEIGTYIGYSSAVMLEECESVHVTTLEKDEQNFLDAKQNLSKFGSRVEILNCDAFDFLKQQFEKLQNNKNLNVDEEGFDFIFLDGPKGQYLKYFPYIKALLRKGGVLMCDDILFHGYVDADGKVGHKHHTIVMNMRKFLEDLKNDSDFSTTFYDFEDGVCVSLKKC